MLYRDSNRLDQDVLYFMHTKHLFLPRANLWLILMVTLKLGFCLWIESSLLHIVHRFLEVWRLSLFVFRRVQVSFSWIVYRLSIVKDVLLSLSDFKLNRSYLIDCAPERRHCFFVVDLLGFRFRVRSYFAHFHLTIWRDRGPRPLSWVPTCRFLHWKLFVVDDDAVFSRI